MSEPQSPAVYESNLESLALLGRGKVRDILQSGEEDVYRGIGESDRMTLKFRKPA